MINKAIIDLGTNTFHLIIGNVINGQLNIVFKKRIYVKLGQGGLGRIVPESYNRGLEAMQKFKNICTAFGIENVMGLGTSALRNADNAKNFVQDIWDRYQIAIHIIDGLQEAKLIWQGVQLTSANIQNGLVVDIGGGSVECIQIVDGKVEHQHSLPLGIARLSHQFQNADSEHEQTQVESLIVQQLESISFNFNQAVGHTLVGCAGTFELLQNIGSSKMISKNLYEVPIEAVWAWCAEIIQNDAEYHRQILHIPVERLDYIVYAAILIKTIAALYPFDKLLISVYAMKEGAFSNFSLV